PGSRPRRKGAPTSSPSCPRRLKAGACRFLPRPPALPPPPPLRRAHTAPRVLVSPTTDRAQLHAALDGLRARGGTALCDAIATSLEAAGLDPAGVSTTPSP